MLLIIFVKIHNIAISIIKNQMCVKNVLKVTICTIISVVKLDHILMVLSVFKILKMIFRVVLQVV